MSTALDPAIDHLPATRSHYTAWGHLPARLHVLFVTTSDRRGAELAEALAADSASHVELEFALGATEGATRLRDEVFDAVLVSHDPEHLDALELVEALRAAGSEEPMVVLGSDPEAEFAPLCYEIGADAYVAVDAATTRHLIWAVARGVERHRLLREASHLRHLHEKRLHQEHDEAARLINQQRALVRDLESLAQPAGASDAEGEGHASDTAAATSLAQQAVQPGDGPGLNPQLVDHYRELLRAYVIMGSGNLAREMGTLASRLAEGGVTAQQTLQLHVQVLEELVTGLGARSARHVMSRADLLVLEVMIHLAEGYRRLDQDRRAVHHQRLLPGFQELAAAGDAPPPTPSHAASLSDG